MRKSHETAYFQESPQWVSSHRSSHSGLRWDFVDFARREHGATRLEDIDKKAYRRITIEWI